jgi:hypothetical protein
MLSSGCRHQTSTRPQKPDQRSGVLGTGTLAQKERVITGVGGWPLYPRAELGQTTILDEISRGLSSIGSSHGSLAMDVSHILARPLHMSSETRKERDTVHRHAGHLLYT